MHLSDRPFVVSAKQVNILYLRTYSVPSELYENHETTIPMDIA